MLTSNSHHPSTLIAGIVRRKTSIPDFVRSAKESVFLRVGILSRVSTPLTRRIRRINHSHYQTLNVLMRHTPETTHRTVPSTDLHRPYTAAQDQQAAASFKYTPFFQASLPSSGSAFTGDMLRPKSAFTPLNAYSSSATAPSFTVPSSFFTLDPIFPYPVDSSIEKHPVTDRSIAGSNTKLDNMRVYDCFDNGKGHFFSADELYEKGVWIGYLAKAS